MASDITFKQDDLVEVLSILEDKNTGSYILKRNPDNITEKNVCAMATALQGFTIMSQVVSMLDDAQQVEYQKDYLTLIKYLLDTGHAHTSTAKIVEDDQPE